MASTDLKLDDPGSLPRPGPIGRLVRLFYGTASIWLVTVLLDARDNLLVGGTLQPVLWASLAIGLYLVSYIINIGYSRDWGKRPAFVSAAVFAAIAGYGYFTAGSFVTELLAGAIWVWAFYLFSHLGVAFFVSAVIRTPGCEMRAFHDLYSLITGHETKEHYCPAGPLHAIDQWEARRRKRRVQNKR